MDDDYRIWEQANVTAHQQNGGCTVTLFLPQGEIKAEKMSELASLLKGLRIERPLQITHQQNLLIHGVGRHLLRSLFKGLVQIGLGMPGAGGITDVIVCPGPAGCPVSLTQPKALGRTLTILLSQLLGEAPRDLDDVRVTVSGCPDSCPRYRFGTIRLQGAARSCQGNSLPYYRLFIGGEMNGTGPEPAQWMMDLPAKRIPVALMRLVEWYRAERRQDERFSEFLKRKGPERIQGELTPFTKTAGFHQERDLYYDWGEQVPFSVSNTSKFLPAVSNPAE